MFDNYRYLIFTAIFAVAVITFWVYSMLSFTISNTLSYTVLGILNFLMTTCAIKHITT